MTCCGYSPGGSRLARTEACIAAPAGAARGRRWRAVAVAAAAAVIGLAAGLGIGLGLSQAAAPDAVPVAQLAPVGAANPDGRGTVEVVDRGGVREMLVRLDGVTEIAGADYLEAWLMDAAGTRLVSLRALALDGAVYRGEFTVPADLPMAAFGVVDVSAERWDGDPAHSRVSLLRGPLS